MTFRSETETLRARVDELERENAKLMQLAETRENTRPRFDPLRLFRRVAWFLISETEMLEPEEERKPLTPPPERRFTAWGIYVGLYMTALCVSCVFIFLGPLWIFGVPSAATLAALMLVRIWIRSAMRLDDAESKASWAKLFE